MKILSYESGVERSFLTITGPKEEIAAIVTLVQGRTEKNQIPEIEKWKKQMRNLLQAQAETYFATIELFGVCGLLDKK